MSFFTDYEKHVSEREKEGVPPLALNAKQTSEVCELIKLASKSSCDEKAQSELKFLISLLETRINPGVDDAAKIKAEFLGEVIDGLAVSGLDAMRAIKILGKMLGGYNVEILVRALKNSDENIARAAANELKNALLNFISSFTEMRYVTQNIAQMMRYGKILKKFIELVNSFEFSIS